MNAKKTGISYYLMAMIFCFSPLLIAEEQKEVVDLSVEDLLNVQVTSVAKKAQSLNGVINIITKHSSQTQGVSLNAGGGTQEQGFGSLR